MYFVFTGDEFILISGFTKILCTPEYPLVSFEILGPQIRPTKSARPRGWGLEAKVNFEKPRTMTKSGCF